MEITEIHIIIILLIILLFTSFFLLWYLTRLNRGMEMLIAAIRRQWLFHDSKLTEDASTQKGEGHPLSQNAVTSSRPDAHREVDILQEGSDIRRTMDALREKYGLESITLASTDGLVIASSDRDAAKIAAQYIHVMKKGMKMEDSRIQVFEMYYRGSPIIGIVRSDRPLPSTRLSSIEDDTRKILNSWLS
jgi:hypothetical protein